MGIALATSGVTQLMCNSLALIEGVEFTCREVVYRLRRALRQHSIGAGGEGVYLQGFLHRHPP